MEQHFSPEPVRRLTRDEMNAAETMTDQEARYLVDTYYQMQEFRKRTANQTRTATQMEEPNDTLRWYVDEFAKLEGQIKRALDRYSSTNMPGQWSRSIVGIGPVIAAGLMAHIDFERAKTAGAIWRYAGLDPTSVWNKGEKRPWNASLKVICWKIGESFVKVSGNDEDIYGKVYIERKALEAGRNEAGEYADQAKAKLERFNIGKTTDAYAHYSAGRLPPAHIHSRAKRYAVKLFLAHYFEVGFFLEHGKRAPMPYIIEHGGHTHYLEPPNTHLIPGW